MKTTEENFLQEFYSFFNALDVDLPVRERGVFRRIDLDDFLFELFILGYEAVVVEVELGDRWLS